MPEWVVRLQSEPDIYWTDSDEFLGFGSLLTASRYSDEERESYSPGIDAEWFRIPTLGDEVVIGPDGERAEVNALWDTGFQVEFLDREEGGNDAFGYDEVIWSVRENCWEATGPSKRFVTASAEGIIYALAWDEVD